MSRLKKIKRKDSPKKGGLRRKEANDLKEEVEKYSLRHMDEKISEFSCDCTYGKGHGSYNIRTLSTSPLPIQAFPFFSSLSPLFLEHFINYRLFIASPVKKYFSIRLR